MSEKNTRESSKLSRTFIGRWLQHYRDYAKACVTSGFIPRTSRLVQFFARLAARLWLFVQVGRMRIVGVENLKAPGRLVFTPNHSGMFDFLAFIITGYGTRYMGAYEEMSGLGGLKAIVMGACGTFPVDRANGKTVIAPATKLLVDGNNLLLFPEGRVSTTREMLPFKTGAARIANAAYEQLGKKEPVGIVPIRICYHGWEAKTAAEDNYLKMGLRWRRGVTVTVCKPLWLHELPSCEPDDIMAAVRAAILQHECK